MTRDDGQVRTTYEPPPADRAPFAVIRIPWEMLERLDQAREHARPGWKALAIDRDIVEEILR
jgi:hypothetical protein